MTQVEAVQWIEPFYPKKLSNDVGRGIINVNLAWQRMATQGVNLYGAPSGRGRHGLMGQRQQPQP